MLAPGGVTDGSHGPHRIVDSEEANVVMVQKVNDADLPSVRRAFNYAEKQKPCEEMIELQVMMQGLSL